MISGFKLASEEDKNYLYEVLKDRGLGWNEVSKQLEYTRGRVAKWERYYTIKMNNYYSVEWVVDTYAEDNENDYLVGNYFPTME